MSTAQATTAQAAVEQEEEQVVAPEGQATQQQEAEVETDADGNAFAAGSADAIPEKFVGKSPLEIIHSYQEAEKTISRLGSEKAHQAKEAEELKSRYAQLEAQLRQVAGQQQGQSAAHQQQPPVDDPLQVLESKWADNPFEAIKESISTIDRRARQKEWQQQVEANNVALARKYESMKTNLADFAALEPKMVELSYKLQHLIQPGRHNHPDTLETLYKIAKAENFDVAVKAEADKKSQKSNLIRTEKKGAFSESGATRGESVKKAEDMSRAELRALIGYSDKY